MNPTPESVILQKLNDLCRQIQDGFKANQIAHESLDERLRTIETDAAKAVGHTHAHCEDCLTHITEIKNIKKEISLRDKIGIGAILAFIATAIKAWFTKW